MFFDRREWLIKPLLNAVSKRGEVGEARSTHEGIHHAAVRDRPTTTLTRERGHNAGANGDHAQQGNAVLIDYILARRMILSE